MEEVKTMMQPRNSFSVNPRDILSSFLPPPPQKEEQEQ